MTATAGSDCGGARHSAATAADPQTPGAEECPRAEQVSREQRLDVIGRFAGKVAHDFNNVLTAIVGYGNLLLLRMEPGDPLRAYAEQILAASDRGTQITQGLLTFGTRQPLNIRPVDLNKVVERAAGRAVAQLGENIALLLTLSPGPLPVIADTEMVEQMLANILSNARDAMPGGGRLTVMTETAAPSRDASAANADGEPRSYAVISIEDTGHGMDAATLGRVFEPLFTTKPKGKGLGLGLAVVYGIAKQHGGMVRIASEVGKGTTVRICLPLIEAPAPKAAEKK